MVEKRLKIVPHFWHHNVSAKALRKADSFVVLRFARYKTWTVLIVSNGSKILG